LALFCGLAALLFPATALAHGRNAPVATSFRAKVATLAVVMLEGAFERVRHPPLVMRRA